MQTRLNELRGRVRNVIWLHGAGLTLAILLASLLIACLFDYSFHASTELRLLFWSLLVLAVAAVGWRWLYLPLRVPVSDLDLALRVERMHPDLKESLSSSVEFLQVAESSPFEGSRELRERVIADARSGLGPLDLGSIVGTKPVKRGLIAAVSALAAALAFFAARPTDASLALRRFLDPFHGPAWPKQTRLRLVSAPTRLAKGDAFAMEVAVEGVQPDRVLFSCRFSTSEETPAEPLPWVRDGVCRGGFEPVTRSFEFRVIAGDAQTDWQPVEVAPAPEIVSLRLRVTHPKYTGLPDEELAEGRGHLRAVVGSKVTLEAAANKPLKKAELAWDSGTPLEAKLGDDPARFQASFVVERDDHYRLLLLDREEMSNATRSPKRYPVQAAPDNKPEVTIERPGGDLDVTAVATVPVRVLAKDDFGVGGLEIRYAKEDLSSPPKDAPQKDASRKDAPSAGALAVPHATIRLPFEGNDPRRVVSELAWNLAPLGLKQGEIVHFHAWANDRRDRPAPNEAKSRELRLRIVSAEELRRQLDAAQQLLREEIERARQMQETALAQVRDAQRQATMVGKLDERQLEELQSAELTQRRVRDKLGESDQGVRRQVQRLLETERLNQLHDVDSSKRLALIGAELARLSEQHLPAIDQSLTQARKSARKEPDASQPGSSASSPQPETAGPNDKSTPKESGDKRPAGKSSIPNPKNDQAAKPSVPKSAKEAPTQSPSVEPKAAAPAESAPSKLMETTAAHLESARGHQGHVVESLTQMLDQLEKWETVAKIGLDARELTNNQSKLKQSTEKLAKETSGKNDSDLSSEQRSQLAKNAERQEQIRDQWQRLQQKMARLADKTERDDPLASDALKEAMKQADAANLGGKLADAASDLRQNKMGKAAERHREIEQALNQLLDSLESRPEQELARLVKRLEETEKELDDLEKQQRMLRKKNQDAAQKPDSPEKKDELRRLSKQQQELQKKSEELARRLSKLKAQSASVAAGRASGRMDQAGRQMDKGEGENAGESQDKAAEDLEEARAETAKARKQAEQELAQEQLAKISDGIKLARDRQANVGAELDRLEARRQEKKSLTRGELHSLSSLATTESGLAEETKSLSSKLTAAKVFVSVLDQAIQDMTSASLLMKERKTDAPTKAHVEGAVRRFDQLLDALKPIPPGQGQQQQQQEGGEGSGGQDGIPNIAQIKLLRTLQADLNQRSDELAKSLAGVKAPTPEQQRQLVELARRQGKLAQLIDEVAPRQGGGESDGDEQ